MHKAIVSVAQERSPQPGECTACNDRRGTREAALAPMEERMRKRLATIAILATLIATNASAQVQGVDLNGRYECVLMCAGATGGPAFITQNGWELNILNDVGEPSRAWVNYPGRIWVDRANQGAIY